MVHRFQLTCRTTGKTDIVDLSREVASEVANSGVTDGALLLFVPGSTAALSTIEFEPGVVQDLKEAIDRVAPTDIPYAHDQAWGDGNGHAHVRAALLKPDLTIPIEEGQLALGTWQQIVLLDFDNRPRSRLVKGYLREW